MAANVRHSADHADWYTPADIVERARRVMGHIWLDPFSHPEANKTVMADVFYTEKDDGLAQSWVKPRSTPFNPTDAERVFINPPGGLVNDAWLKLMDEWPFEWLWVGFSLEQLQTLQSAIQGQPHPLDFNYCIPARRIPYVENAAKRRKRKAKAVKDGKTFRDVSAPSHASYIAYSGPHSARFYDEFSPVGKVVLQ